MSIITILQMIKRSLCIFRTSVESKHAYLVDNYRLEYRYEMHCSNKCLMFSQLFEQLVSFSIYSHLSGVNRTNAIISRHPQHPCHVASTQLQQQSLCVDETVHQQFLAHIQASYIGMTEIRIFPCCFRADFDFPRVRQLLRNITSTKQTAEQSLNLEPAS